MKNAIQKFDPLKVSIVTSCMNRNRFLLQSIPSWLEIGFLEIIVVDWNSEISVFEYLQENLPSLGVHNVTVVRSAQHAMKEYFNDGWARNTGARLCRSPFIFFMDSDIKISNSRILYDCICLHADICYRGNIPGGYGTCLVSAGKFSKINGYNERMWSWGGEDLDLYIRLKIEQGCEIETFFPTALLEHAHHDDDLRIKYRLQEWDDLKQGADIQRLERPTWTTQDIQQKVMVNIRNTKQNINLKTLV